MRIEIEIPKEFEEHFNQDKFKDSFGRIMEEIRSNLRSRYCSYAGRYEYETIEMLQKAFENSRKAYDVDKVVEELKEAKHEICLSDEDLEHYQNGIDNAIEIVKQGGVADDVCEWKLDGDMAINPHTFIKYKVKQYDSLYALDTCQYCRKKIKVVE